jgi:hypothetical protein
MQRDNHILIPNKHSNMNNVIEGWENIKEFITTDMPSFNLINLKTSNSVGYKVKKVKQKPNAKPLDDSNPSWRVYGGQENLFLGYMKIGSNGLYLILYKMEGASDSYEVLGKGFKALLHFINTQQIPSHVVVQHNGVCGKCCRVLTDPTSIALGIGPKCRGYSLRVFKKK